VFRWLRFPRHDVIPIALVSCDLALLPPCLLTTACASLSQVRLVINDVPPEALHLGSELGGHHGRLSAIVD